MKQLALLALLLVVGLGLWSQLGRRPGSAPVTEPSLPAIEPKASSEGDQRARGSNAEPEALLTVEGDRQEARDARASSTAGKSVRIEATVRDERGRALEGIPLACMTFAGIEPARSDALGEIVLTLDDEGDLALLPMTLSFRLGGESFVGVTEDVRLTGPGWKFLGHFVLRPAGAVRGRVVDSNGRPIGNVAVTGTEPRFTGTDPSSSTGRIFSYGDLGTAVTTEADGRFVLGGLPLTTCSILARFPGHFLGVSEPVHVLPDSIAEVADVVLVSAGAENRIAGVVLDAKGQARVGDSVELQDADGRYVLAWTKTDATGRFELLVEAEGPYRLKAGRLGRDWLYAYGISAGTLDVVLRPEDRPSFELRVQDVAGRPIAGYHRQLVLEDGVQVPGSSYWTTSLEAVQVYLPERPFRIVIGSSRTRRFESELLTEETLTGPYVAILERIEGLFSGRVLSAGEPVPGVQVDAHLVHSSTRIRKLESGLHKRFDSRIHRASTDEAGRFELGFQASAMRLNGYQAVHLHVVGPGSLSSLPLWIQLPEEGEPLEPILEVVSTGSLEGTVEAPPGIDLRGLAVAVSQADDHIQWRELDASGTFVFEALAPGPWQAVIRKARDLAAQRDGEVGTLKPKEDIPWDFEIIPGETTRFDPLLEPSPDDPCILSGRFLVNGDTPVGWTWSFHAESETEKGRFDAEGRFEVGLKQTGDGRLHLAPPGRSACAFGSFHADLNLHPGTNTWTYDLASASVLVTGLPEPLADAEANLGLAEERCVLGEWSDPIAKLHWQARFICAPLGGLLAADVPSGTLTFRHTEGFVPMGGPGLVLELLPGEEGRIHLGEDR